MNGWLKGIGTAIALAILGVLGQGWLSHADKDDLKTEKTERVAADNKLEKKGDKTIDLIAKIQEKLAQQSEVNAAQIVALEHIKDELKELQDK